ncbi:protein jagged-2-like isoform X1 [Dreissena polymorpha]|uniref:protein jagged-2-like isoform X1 n=1 Tax=Dreissena polymorpha TaxID=45954 RepID=UPI00226450B0|nr:protein jagged-2-like isoform X1 [Dreissena polymorpha]
MFLLVVRLTLLQVILNRGYSVEACSHDNECPHCTGHNFQARCRYNYCDCYPVDCDPSPCPSTLICVAEPDDYSCREHCTVNCPVGQTCIKTNRGQICIDPCVPNPCSSGKTCVHTDNAPFYVCQGYSVEACSHDSDCSPCKDQNLRAKCSYGHCDCNPVHCDPSPCLSTLICVAEPHDYRCRGT